MNSAKKIKKKTGKESISAFNPARLFGKITSLDIEKKFSCKFGSLCPFSLRGITFFNYCNHNKFFLVF